MTSRSAAALGNIDPVVDAPHPLSAPRVDTPIGHVSGETAQPAHPAGPSSVASPDAAPSRRSGLPAHVSGLSAGWPVFDPTGHRVRHGAELLAADPAGLAHVSRMVEEVLVAARAGLRRRNGPLPTMTPAQFAARVDADLAGGVLPRHGAGPSALLALARRYAEGTVDLADPTAAAHLQPPALTVAVAADVLANAFNASVDTWDSGPYAVELERRVVRALADLAGLGSAATGVFTSGGTASNLQALLIARDRTPGTGRKVVFCSEVGHFSIARACGVLGLGADAVRPLPTDGRWRIRPEALRTALGELADDEIPIAIVATAGTTDFGSIDPLPEIAEIAAESGVRLHVDAAYGGGALFSDRLRPLLDGLHLADSVTIDLHKTAWQPAAASVLLVRDPADFGVTDDRVDYLNPDDDSAAGYDGLLGCSLATTRRADAVKVAATFGVLGRDGIGGLFDTCHDLARYAAARIAADPRLELVADPVLSTVVFRYRPARGARQASARATVAESADSHACTESSVATAVDPAWVNHVNGALRRRLMRTGAALIGRTSVPGYGVCLKLTLLNPQARAHDIDVLLDAVVRAGEEEESVSE